MTHKQYIGAQKRNALQIRYQGARRLDLHTDQISHPTEHSQIRILHSRQPSYWAQKYISAWKLYTFTKERRTFFVEVGDARHCSRLIKRSEYQLAYAKDQSVDVPPIRTEIRIPISSYLRCLYVPQRSNRRTCTHCYVRSKSEYGTSSRWQEALTDLEANDSSIVSYSEYFAIFML